MQSSLSMKVADPHDIFAIEPDFTPTPRTETDAPTLIPEAAGAPLHREPHFGPSPAPTPAAPAIEPSYRATAPANDIKLDDVKPVRVPPPRSRWAVRMFWFVFAIGSAGAAAAWDHYGDRVKRVADEWTPQVAALTSLIPGKSTAQTAQPNAAAAAPAVAADQPAEQAASAPPQQDAAAAPAPAASAAPVAAAAPEPVAAPQDQQQLLQSMARDIAGMGQQIQQLKSTIDQLKAGQDQLSQRVARAPEAKASDVKPVQATAPAAPPRARVSTLPPRPAVAAPPRRPTTTSYVPSYVPPPPTAAAPLPPATTAQAAPPPVALQSAPPPRATTADVADDDGPVVRPPMPVR